MKIYYGSQEKFSDITQICYTKLLKNGIIEIPYSNKLRQKIFSKSSNDVHNIFIKVETNKMLEYNENYIIQINSLDNTIQTIHISFIIYYGTLNNMFDITEICINKLKKNNIIQIPNDENKRKKLFNLHINNIKKMFIKMNNKMYEFNNNYIININLITKNIHTICTNKKKLTNLHSILKLNYGNFQQELPEQQMIVKYLSGYNNVLEIGSNIGRSSLIISSILKETNNINFVTLETDKNIAQKLLENKEENNLCFHIENSALSKKKIIQKDWETIISDVLLDGYNNVNTITWEELNKKYNIQFDTLVLDCEGAFYNILIDFPEILDNIKLIIMENDYNNITKKEYIDNVLLQNNFHMIYCEGNGWGPCTDYFYEVWKK